MSDLIEFFLQEEELKECGGNVFVNGCLEFLAPEVDYVDEETIYKCILVYCPHILTWPDGANLQICM